MQMVLVMIPLEVILVPMLSMVMPLKVLLVGTLVLLEVVLEVVLVVEITENTNGVRSATITAISFWVIL